LYLQLKTLVDLKEGVSNVCKNNNISNLTVKQWKKIDLYLNLYKPFDDATNDLSKEDETTSSKVIPTHIYLLNHFKKIKENKKPRICEYIQNLIVNLQSKFDQFVNINNSNNTRLFLAAMFLDVRYSKLLKKQQLNAVKEYMESLIDDTSSVQNDSIDEIKEDETELSAFDSFILQVSGFNTIPESSSRVINFQKQFIEYVEFVHRQRFTNMKMDPLNFWLTNMEISNLTEVKKIALKILAIPGSTATIERIFSLAGYASSGRANRLSCQRLEMLVLLKVNKEYLKNANYFH
jgi:hypothetical protein